jgi:hypothetical protein
MRSDDRRVWCNRQPSLDEGTTTMTTSDRPAWALPADQERELGKSLFNATWTLLEKDDRTSEQDEAMVHMAHASRHHWAQVGEPEHRARGEWQCARVYSVLRRPEPALHHARRALEICQQHGLSDWDLAAACEAMARAWAVAGEMDEARHMTELALAACDAISDQEDRQIIETDLETIPGQPRFW